MPFYRDGKKRKRDRKNIERKIPRRKLSTRWKKKKKDTEGKMRNICLAVMADWLAPNCSKGSHSRQTVQRSRAIVYPFKYTIKARPLLGEVAIDSRPCFFSFFLVCSIITYWWPVFPLFIFYFLSRKPSLSLSKKILSDSLLVVRLTAYQ